MSLDVSVRRKVFDDLVGAKITLEMTFLFVNECNVVVQAELCLKSLSTRRAINRIKAIDLLVLLVLVRLQLQAVLELEAAGVTNVLLQKIKESFVLILYYSMLLCGV